MRAIIAGGTGFIGRALVAELRTAGWDISVLSRSPDKVASLFGNGVDGLAWDGDALPGLMGPETMIVNLAGENIAGRWSAEKKHKILQSRLEAGQDILEAIQRADAPPATLVQASAVGYYGPLGDSPVDETAPCGSGFLADVARQWEASTQAVEDMGVRRVIVRTGVVLGHGGALEQMLPPFRFFVGGPPGSGRQGVSWIHLADEVGAIRFLMETPETSGAYNLTAPEPVQFSRLAHVIGNILNRPYKLNVPGFALRLLFGQMADEVLLSGQLALPGRLQQAGYRFRFPELEAALRDILG